MARVEQLIQRGDGAQVKIVAQDYFGQGLRRSVGVDVLYRESPNQPWRLANPRPHPNWLEMPVADYVAFGRSEMLRVASTAEILKAVSALNASVDVDSPKSTTVDVSDAEDASSAPAASRPRG